MSFQIINQTPLNNPMLSSFQKNLIYAFLLLLTLISLALGWQHISAHYQHNLDKHFQSESDRINTVLIERLNADSNTLRGGAGLFAASGIVTREAFHHYVEKLDLEHNLKGVQGVGYARLIRPQQMEAHIAAVRREGYPAYSVKPAGKRISYTSIIYLEPFSGRNLRAFGFDMCTEPVRCAAMELARDSGKVAYSGKVKLIQETSKDVQAGILVYQPVYDNGKLQQTREQRRAALLGWVYSPYRMNDFIAGMIGSNLNKMHLEIYDGKVIKPEALLFDSLPLHAQAPIHYTRIFHKELGGRTWTLRYTDLPGFIETASFQSPSMQFVALLACGLLMLISILLTFKSNKNRKLAEQLAVANADLVVHAGELDLVSKAIGAASLAKSQFLANMSHELRTPLNGILGMAQILVQPNIKEVDRLNYARVILQSGNNLLSLLNDILDISKIEAGKIDLESIVFSPLSIIDEVKTLYVEVARNKDLKVQINAQFPLDQQYLGDPNRVRQMLNNLLSNAIKFTNSGQVQIEGREISRDKDEVLLEFAVTDTGIGIANDKLATLFQPFTQLDSSISRQFGGTGLGLSIVDKFAVQMGGQAGVSSEAEVGSRFWFNFRAKLVNHNSVIKPWVEPVKVNLAQLSGRVLLVDDSEINSSVITGIFKQSNIVVTVVENGLLALNRITSGEPVDLVLMDIQMPVMNGYEATLKIRLWEAEGNRTRLPIIALTANAYDEDRQHCLSAGMDDFIAKPIDFEQLIIMLTRHLPCVSVCLAATQYSVPDEREINNTAQAALLYQQLEIMLTKNKFDAIFQFRKLQETCVSGNLAAELARIARLLETLNFEDTLKQLAPIALAQGWKDINP